MFALIALHYIFNILKIRRKNSRKKGMIFKPSFKCFKNKKIIFIQVILRLECLFYQNKYIYIYIYIYIISSCIIFVERFRLKNKKKSGLTV
jgi:hypothetical protein